MVAGWGSLASREGEGEDGKQREREVVREGGSREGESEKLCA